MKQTINVAILNQLRLAPETQLARHLKEKCINFKGTEKELFMLFQEIFNSPDDDKSRFIKQLVNPTFTKKYIGKI